MWQGPRFSLHSTTSPGRSQNPFQLAPQVNKITVETHTSQISQKSVDKNHTLTESFQI